MICASLVFSILSALIKYIGNEIPAVEIIFLRSVISLIIIFPIALIFHIHLIIKQNMFLILRGLTGFCAFSLFYYAITKAHLTKVSVIMQTRPFIVMILAHFFLKERLTGKELLLLTVSFTGVLFLLQPGHYFADLDLISMICLLGVFFAASSAVLIKHITKSVPSVCIIFYFMLVSSICSIPLVIPCFVTPKTPELLIIILISVLSLLAQWLMTEAIRFSRTTMAMAVGYTGVIFSTFWELIFWHSMPDTFTITGGVLVGISIILLALKESHNSKVKKATNIRQKR